MGGAFENYQQACLRLHLLVQMSLPACDCIVALTQEPARRHGLASYAQHAAHLRASRLFGLDLERGAAGTSSFYSQPCGTHVCIIIFLRSTVIYAHNLRQDSDESYLAICFRRKFVDLPSPSRSGGRELDLPTLADSFRVWVRFLSEQWPGLLAASFAGDNNLDAVGCGRYPRVRAFQP